MGHRSLVLAIAAFSSLHVAAADAQGQGEEDLEDEEEDASWRWEGEDDFTLGHVWEVRVRNPKHGIVYVRAHFPWEKRKADQSRAGHSFYVHIVP